MVTSAIAGEGGLGELGAISSGSGGSPTASTLVTGCPIAAIEVRHELGPVRP